MAAFFRASAVLLWRPRVLAEVLSFYAVCLPRRCVGALQNYGSVAVAVMHLNVLRALVTDFA